MRPVGNERASLRFMRSIKDLRIVFFGTPDFAVASLKALVEAGAQVVAVVTAPDKPSGRGLQLSQTPVKVYALEQGIPVMQPPKLKNEEFLAELKAFAADVHVVVAFRMLPEAVWAMPPMGTVNVHGSLLPQYRGAAPINWAIINGETETGVTTFRLKHEIDTGNILLQDRVEILADDDAGTVHDKLMAAGANLLVRTLDGLAAGTITAVPQPEGGEIKHAPKIFKEDTRIDWGKSAEAVRNFIRGMAPYPGAFTVVKEKNLKVYRGRVELGAAEVGAVDSDGKSYLRIGAADGWVYLEELQLEGKKRMGVVEFLRGFRAVLCFMFYVSCFMGALG
jgi:methionyl-tRNA formyltransferase